MSSQEFVSRISPQCFWDVDIHDINRDEHASYIVQRVLQMGTLDDWKLISHYYGLDQIVKICQALRSLDPISLSFICAISGTDKSDYRCFQEKQSSPTLSRKGYEYFS